MPAFDRSTWLAHVATLTKNNGGFQQPTAFALPGAKAAIAADRLAAHLETGKTVHQVAARVNAAWARAPENLLRARQQKAWVRQYDQQVQDMRQQEQLAATLEATRAARVEAELEQLATEQKDT